MNAPKQAWTWFEDRAGILDALRPAFMHPVPASATWMYVFGTATLFSFIVQAVTGVFLALTYIPASGQAYASMQFITRDAVLGHWLRGIHFYGASAMVFFIGIHMARVFLTGAFKFPRELNWLTGVLLFLFTLGNAFTGQLLRFDQNAIWTAIVGGQMASRVPWIGPYLSRFWISDIVYSANTLQRYFLLHVYLFPGGILAVVGVHLYLILRHGISEPPKAGRLVDPATYRQWYEKLIKETGEPFFPDAAWRDVVFSTIVIVGIVILGGVFGAPRLIGPPDPSNIDVLPKPDWWLLWVFGVLALVPPAVEPWVMVLGPAVLFGLLAVVPFLSNRGERHPLRRPFSVLFVFVTVTAMLVLWRLGAREPWTPDFNVGPLPESVIGASSGPVYEGGQLFYERGCEYCHTVDGYGGTRGPNLSTIGSQRDTAQLTVRILHGGINMPAFASILTPQEVQNLVAFLESRTFASHPRP
jgi:ubiquinol-cytochrome c reductase cytochrome b subunit